MHDPEKKPILSRISIIDFVNLAFLTMLAVFFLISFNDTPYRVHLLVSYPVLAVFVLVMARLRNGKRLLMVIYPVIFLFAVFETFFMLLPYFNTARYDELMISIDHALFGVHPTVWLEALISTPVTELMYLLYLFYFPMPLFILIWLYRKRRFLDMERSFFVLLLTYYGAYVVYFFVPVEGPRFHLGELQSIPLTGLLFSEPIRRLIDFLEPNKLDCFPSLHAAITCATLLVTRRYNRNLFRWLLPAAAGIMVSLVYCRYHYFIDVVAGIVWAAACYWMANSIYNGMFHRFAPHFGRDGK